MLPTHRPSVVERIQLPGQLPSGAWAHTRLVVLGSGWAQLSSVPFPFLASTVERLKGLGAYRICIHHGGVVRFRAKGAVVQHLSGSFPSCCLIA